MNIYYLIMSISIAIFFLIASVAVAYVIISEAKEERKNRKK